MTVDTVKKQRILDSLEPLFERAEKEGLWFRSGYGGGWFSPDELRKEHENNKFLWGFKSWELRNPEEELGRLKEGITRAKDHWTDFAKRMKRQ